MLRSKLHIRRKGAFFSILAVVLFALVGLTIAFNSDIKLFGNLFKAGAYQAEYKEEFTSPSDWTPCEEVPKLVNVKNNSPVNLKVRLTYDEFWRNKANTSNLPLEKDGTQLAVINFQNEDDWEQRGEWYYYKEDLEPGESTSSLFKSVTLDCHANLSVGTICYDTPEGTVCSEPDDDDAYDKYHLLVTVQTSDEDFPREDEHYTVTIDPNGGEYNGSTNVYSESLQFGTVVDLTSISYTDHELINWTKNGSDSYVGDTIRVSGPLTLKANWQSSIFHTISVDLAGGELEGETTIPDTQVRREEYYTFTDTEPTREGYLFDGWELSNGSMLTEHTWQVLSDETLTAKWSLIVAQNNRTSKFYRSITAAEAEASSGDTISLVADAEEEFTNTKNITLNLNALKLNGSITNNGTLTLLNGEVENTEGTAVINNGTLTMGINDFIDENTVNIENNYVRIKGTAAGMEQNGTFNYYDGYIEGEIALDGGYDDSPFYRKAFDDEEVHYFPFVDKSPDDNTIQRITLESSDLAHSKTIVGGDIYYYNIQDNINTSIRTGYKIYIVRDDFATGYGLHIPEGEDITIDIDGHNFTVTGAIQNDGKLTIEDGKTTTAHVAADDTYLTMPNINNKIFTTPHENSITTTTYAGQILTPQTIINNGNLLLNRAIVTGTSSLDVINNNGSLSMRAGAIGATNGYITKPIEGSLYDLDDNSYLYSSGTAIYNNTPNYIWDGGGVVYSFGSYGINASSKIIIESGVIYGKNTGATGSIELNGGAIKSSSTGMAGGSLVQNGGSIIVSAPSSEAIGLDRVRSITLNGGDIIVSGKSAQGSYSLTENGTIKVNGGNISATATTGSAIGMTSNYKSITMTGGSVKGVSASGTSYGIRMSDDPLTITTGKVEGGTYGVYVSSDSSIVIGNSSDAVSTSDPEIIGGQYALYGADGKGSAKFYDGVLRGGIKAYTDGILAGTPDATSIHIEASESYAENCWLVATRNYLSVNGFPYNSLTTAYAAITGDSGTIEVTEDITIESTHPDSPSGKTITFDLKGHRLTYAQPLKNNGTMIIEDNSPGKTGKLIGYGTQSTTIQNSGNLTINSGYFTSNYRTISNGANSSLTINGGTIESDGGTCIVSNSNSTININNGIIGGQNASTGINGGTTTITSGQIKMSRSGATGAKSGSLIINMSDPTATAILVNPASGSSTGADGTKITLENGVISVSSESSSATGMYGGSLVQNGGSIIVSAPSSEAIGLDRVRSITLNGGDIIVSGKSAQGSYSLTENGTIKVNGGNISATATTGSAIGMTSNYKSITMTGGSVKGVSASGTSYGIRMSDDPLTITTGKVEGGTYGVYVSSDSSIVIGNSSDAVSTSDPEIIGGQYALYGADGKGSAKFYDGVLRGGIKAYTDGILAGTPDATSIHIEASESYAENCWLVATRNYLSVNGFPYNSLTTAYAAITGDSGTIEVTEDITIESTHPDSPSGKTITFDLKGHRLTYAQPLKNNGTMIIEDNSPGKTGKLIGYGTQSTTIQNSGNLTINSGYFTSNYRTISNGANSSLTINGGTIESDGGTCIVSNSNSTININNGIIGGQNASTGINGGTTTITSGQIKMSRSGATGAKSGSLIINMSDPTATAILVNPASGSSTGADGTKITLENGVISVSSESSSATGMYGGSLVQNGGSIIVSAPSSEAIGLDRVRSITLNGGDIIVSGKSAQGSYSLTENGTIKVNGGNISATATTGSAIGMTSNYKSITMTGGSVKGVSASGTSYGIRMSDDPLTITTGKVEGGTYGVYVSSDSSIVIGNSSDAVSTSDPEIIGGQYALYGADGKGSAKFYDGVLRGGIKAYTDGGIVKTIPEGYSVKIENQVIDDTTYDTRYLIASDYVARIGSAQYTTLSDAIYYVPQNGIITLTADNYIFSAITIPAEKTFTIETDGFSIIPSSPITNNGKVAIISSPTSLLEHYSTKYAITNNEGAELSITNLSLKVNYGIENKGLLSLSNSSIVAKETALNNIGTIEATGISLDATSYPIYNNGGETTIMQSSMANGAIYNNAGTLTLKNSSAAKLNSASTSFISNKGTALFYNLSVTHNMTSTSYTYQTQTYAIYNKGSLSVLDGSSISHIATNPSNAYCYYRLSSVYNDGGNVTAADSSLISDSTNAHTSKEVYGIYNNSGTVTIKTGSVQASGKDSKYGIYVNSGTAIIGDPEPADSPNYGRANADVKQDSPSIQAIGSNGVGVKNYNKAGQVYYYDGVVSGSTAAFAEEPTETEHFYEVCTELDTSVTPNLYTSRLFWMRDGQSSCGN